MDIIRVVTDQKRSSTIARAKGCADCHPPPPARRLCRSCRLSPPARGLCWNCRLSPPAGRLCRSCQLSFPARWLCRSCQLSLPARRSLCRNKLRICQRLSTKTPAAIITVNVRTCSMINTVTCIVISSVLPEIHDRLFP